MKALTGLRYRDVKRNSQRRNQGVVGSFFIVMAIILALALLTGCSMGRAELDPRDEATLEEQDCQGASAYLNVENQSSFSMRIIIMSRGGSRWTLQPQIQGFGDHTYEVSRHFLDSGGYILLDITGGGLVTMPPRPIPMTSLRCDTGTLFITPSPSMSSYVGADF